VRSPLLPIRTAERLLEPLMLRFEADHLTREPLEHLRAEGFALEPGTASLPWRLRPPAMRCAKRVW